jgi:hypothetical protein
VHHPAGALAWLVNPFVAGNTADMLTTNAAMLAFDAEPGSARYRDLPWC